METIRGKSSMQFDGDMLKQQLACYRRMALDLGTGDGRFVCQLAKQHPDWYAIGVDACRANLREHSRTGPPNTLFVIAAAEDLPPELHGQASYLTVNFPWGSLLRALLEGDQHVMAGLASLSGPYASLEVRVNGEALAEAGWTLDAGTSRICESLFRSGWQVTGPRLLGVTALQAFPSTWARRLAHGRDPRAMLINASLAVQTPWAP